MPIVDPLILGLATECALGKQSYIVYTVTTNLMRNWKDIPGVLQFKIVTMIKDTLAQDEAGDEIARQYWTKVLYHHAQHGEWS